MAVTLAKPRTAEAGVPRRWSVGHASPPLSVAEQIAEQLSDSIIEGHFEPGQRLAEQEIGASFGVSRGPIREVMRILEKEGLVELKRRRGAHVSNLSLAEINDIFEIRSVLLGLAARQTCQRNDPRVVAELVAGAKRISALAKSNADAGEYVNSTYSLNLFLAESSGNEPLRAMIFSLARRTLRYAMLGLSTAERRLQSARNWRRLARAIEKCQPLEAEAAARRLVDESREKAVKLLRRQAPKGADQTPSSL